LAKSKGKSSLTIREYGTYGDNGFYVDFNDDLNKAARMVRRLQNNKWMDEQTRAVVMQWTVLNVWSNTFYTARILFENPGNDVFTNKIQLENAFFYNDLVEETASSTRIIIIVLYSLLILNIVFFIAKIFFEMSLGINKLTNSIEFVNVFFQLAACFVKYTK